MRHKPAISMATVPMILALGGLSCSGPQRPGPLPDKMLPTGTRGGPRVGAVHFADLAKSIRPMNPGDDDERHEFPAPQPISRADVPGPPPRVAPRAPVEEEATPPRDSPEPIDSFGGVFGDYSTADTHGAVGPSHLVTAVNRAIVVQSRDGLRQLLPVPLDAFWNPILGPDRHDAFDPRVLYDRLQGRWIIVAAYRSHQPETSAIFVAVSDGGDPTAGWRMYEIPAEGVGWLDYPSVGLDRDRIVISCLRYVKLEPRERVLFVIHKARLYNREPQVYEVLPFPAKSVIPAAVAVDQEEGVGPLYLVESGPSASGAGYLQLWELTASGSKAALSRKGGPIYGNAPYWAWTSPDEGYAFARQDDPKGWGIDNGDARMQNVVYCNGSIWCAHTIFLPHNGPTVSTVQWWEIKPDGAVAQQGRIGLGGEHGVFRAYPSLAINMRGDVLLGYSRFSRHGYASASYAFHGHEDAEGSTRGEVVYKPGLDVYRHFETDPYHNPWGDYSNTVVDPSGLDFWTVQKYAERRRNRGSERVSRWGTWWAHVPAQSDPLPPAAEADRPVTSSSNAGRPAEGGVSNGRVGPESDHTIRRDVLSKPRRPRPGELLRDLSWLGARVPFRPPLPPAASADAYEVAPKVSAADATTLLPAPGPFDAPEHSPVNLDEKSLSVIPLVRPSLAARGRHVLLMNTQFWARSLDSGRTFTQGGALDQDDLDPYRVFHKQIYGYYATTAYDARRDITFWVFEFQKVKQTTPVEGGDSIENEERRFYRIAFARGDRVAENRWEFVDCDLRRFVQRGQDKAFITPEIAFSDNYLYLMWNVLTPLEYGEQLSFDGSLLVRIGVDRLLKSGTTERSLAIDRYYLRGVYGLRAVAGAGDTMYWAAHKDRATLRVYAWPEDDNLSSQDVAVRPWGGGLGVEPTLKNGKSVAAKSTVDYIAPGPDGRNWMSNLNGWVSAGWLSRGTLGFVWTAPQEPAGGPGVPSRPLPHVRAVLIRSDGPTPGDGTRPLKVVAQPEIWSPEIAFAYAKAVPADDGRVAIGLHYGGPKHQPGFALGLLRADTGEERAQWEMTPVIEGGRRDRTTPGARLK